MRLRRPQISVLRAWAWLLAAALGGLACSPARASGPPVDDPWLRIETESFTIFSHAPERVGRRVGAGLERLRSVLSHLGGDLKVNSPLPTYLFVFRDDQAFRPYKLQVDRRPASISGYFVSHPLGNYVAIDGDERRGPQRIIYHEYLHYFLRNNFPSIPLWFNEGLAELYSTFDSGYGKDSSGSTVLGTPIRAHEQWLRSHRLIPLERLFAVNSDSADYHEAERKGAFYAQSWALVHYLLIGNPEREEQAGRYLELVRHGVAIDEAFAEAFEVGFDGLETELAAYVAEGRYPQLELDPRDLGLDRAELVDPWARVSPLPPAEVAYRLGDLVAHSVPEKGAFARSHFERALALAGDSDPSAGLAWAGLGFLEDEAGSHGDARGYYQRARELAPGEPLVHFLLGRNRMLPLAGQMRDLTVPDPALEADLEEARRAFARTLELAPDFSEALAGLGSTYALERDVPERAVAILQEAHRRLPSRMDVAFNLAAVYASRGERDEAERLIEGVLVPRADQETVESAREILLSADLRRVQELIEADRIKDALRLLQQVDEAVAGAGGRRHLTQQIRDLEAYADRRRGVDLYNRAVAAANGGELALARELFDQVLQATRDSDLRRQARQQRDRLDRQLDPRLRP